MSDVIKGGDYESFLQLNTASVQDTELLAEYDAESSDNSEEMYSSEVYEYYTEVPAYDDTLLISKLDSINSNIYMIILLLCMFLVWHVLKYVYKFFSMFFSF